MKTKHWIAVFLCTLLITGLLPCIALAADTEISSIDFAFTLPEAGVDCCWSFNKTITITPSQANSTDNKYITMSFYDAETGTRLKSGDYFETGKKYITETVFYPENGYFIGAGTNITFSGKDVNDASHIVQKTGEVVEVNDEWNYVLIRAEFEIEFVNCKVSFDMNGHGEQLADELVPMGSTYTPPTPTAEGYKFLMWKYIPPWSSYYTTFDPGSRIRSDEEMIALWAKEEPENGYSVWTSGDLSWEKYSGRNVEFYTDFPREYVTDFGIRRHGVEMGYSYSSSNRSTFETDFTCTFNADWLQRMDAGMYDIRVIGEDYHGPGANKFDFIIGQFEIRPASSEISGLTFDKPSCSPNESFTLSGCLKTTSGTALAGETLTWTYGNDTATTDEQGNFTFTGTAPSTVQGSETQNITVSYSGKQDEIAATDVTATVIFKEKDRSTDLTASVNKGSYAAGESLTLTAVLRDSDQNPISEVPIYISGFPGSGTVQALTLPDGRCILPNTVKLTDNAKAFEEITIKIEFRGNQHYDASSTEITYSVKNTYDVIFDPNTDHGGNSYVEDEIGYGPQTKHYLCTETYKLFSPDKENSPFSGGVYFANKAGSSSHTFLGWDEDPDAVVPTYKPGDNICDLTGPNQQLTLYAIWALEGQWVKDSKGWWYSCSDGSYLADGIYEIDGVNYAFNEKGYMLTGWYNGTDSEGASCWYHFASSGAMEYGWVKAGNKWYYMDPDDGFMWAASKDNGYLFEIKGKIYSLSESGAMVTGWFKYTFADGTDVWYHFASSGAMDLGWIKLGNKWYYFDPESGMMLAGNADYGFIYKIDGKSYCFDESGAMVTGWYNGTDSEGESCWYYFESSGAMATAKWVGDYYLDAEGIMVTYAYIKNGDKYYWVNKDGKYTRTYTAEDIAKDEVPYAKYEQSTGELMV